MKTKARVYLAKAKQCEERARKTRDAEDRNWQLVLARAYRMLAETESEETKRPPQLAVGDWEALRANSLRWRT
jgi:hypothetical protein